MRSWHISIALLLSLVLLGGGCGDSDDEQPEATATSQATATPGATPALEGPARELFDLFAAGLGTTYKVSYQTSSPEGEEGDRYVIYYQSPLTRIDTFPQGSATISSLLIGGDEQTETIACTGGPGLWRCEEIEPLGESLLKVAGPIIFLSPTDIGSFTVAEVEPRVVAAQTVRCFGLTPNAQANGEEPAEYCFTADGVPVYANSAIGIVEATDFSRDVSDDDFEPPAPP